jgi:lipoprotein-anchoring transpeptidase ErfK/SrfK
LQIATLDSVEITTDQQNNVTLPAQPLTFPPDFRLGWLSFSDRGFIAACGGGQAPTTTAAPSGPVEGYGGMADGKFFIEPVDPALLTPSQRRTEVDYAGDERAGSIVVDIYARKLYHVQEGNRAMRYAIAVGREGLSFTGSGQISRKAEWPSWQPTANMIRSRPDLYAEYASGLEGGADNPLGSRALYLYRGGRDTYFRIHGTIQNESIGRATSAGCIRLFNQDIIHLYEQVELGTTVKVRSLAESLLAEGPYIDDALGFAVPNTPETVDALAAAAEAKAIADAKAAEEKEKADAKAAKERARADKQRLRECRRNNVEEALCPPLPEPELPLDAEFTTKPAITALGGGGDEVAANSSTN